MNPTIILGAGLTGLSAAYHLNRPYTLFEQASRAGGLCRSMERDGFWFDHTGHLLHLRRDYTKNLVHHLLPDTFDLHHRRARIYTHGRTLDYPFQANIHALRPEMIKECIIGFVDTLPHHDAPAPDSFHDWVLRTFGAGIARYFMFPYNQKLWRIPLAQLSADWVSWSIPKPSLDEFLNGALGIRNKAFGYNPTFLYPKQGGIEALPAAFEAELDAGRLRYNMKAVEVDLQHRRVIFEDGRDAFYETLISTLPLKALLGLIRGLPAEVAAAADHLSHIAIYDVNLGVKRPKLADAHWLYFPEPEFPFYRVGFPSNFSRTVTPAGCSSMYVEISALPEEHFSADALRERVLEGLRRAEILRPDDDVAVCDIVRIDCAYVHYTRTRRAALDTIVPYLERHHIHSTGRYGAWEYSSMEDAILAGKAVADTLAER